MTLSNSIKKRFIKEWKLPIQTVQEPLFSYVIETIDPHFQTQEKLKMLTKVIETLGTEEDFFSELNKINNTLIDKIQASDAYKELQNTRLEAYDIEPNGIRQKDIYIMENVNRTFISLDLIKANFNVMRMYNPELTLGYDTYEELIGSVTELDYFEKSKYLRQVIFGNLLPKKQQKLQKFVMSTLINMLHEDVGIEIEDVILSSNDEVLFIIDPTNADRFVEMVERKLKENKITANVADWVRVKSFTLRSIGSKNFFVKEFSNGDVEFKKIPNFLFLQVYRKFTGTEETKLDRMFCYEGFMASFDEGVFDEL